MKSKIQTAVTQKTAALIFAGLLASGIGFAHAEEKIWRCDNSYTSSEKNPNPKVCTQLKTFAQEEKEKLQQCQVEATKAPTELGVRVALRICIEKAKE